MTHRSPTFRRLALVLAGAGLLAAAAPARATLYTYDDGSWGVVRQDRWMAWEASINGSPILDSSRSSGSGALTLSARVGGDPIGPNHSGEGHVGLTFVRSRDIRDIRVTILPKDAVASYDCGSAFFTSSVDTVVSGTFFNTSANTAPDSLAGDVQAWVALRKTRVNDTLSVIAGYGRCNDRRCSYPSPSAQVSLGTASVGSPITIELRWEPANHRFVAIAGGATGTLAYTVNDTHPAHQPDKRLEIVGRPLGCATGGMVVQATSAFSAVQTDVQP